MKPGVFFFIVALLSLSPAFGLEHQWVRHFEEQFRLPGDPRTFTRHVLIPVEREYADSIATREILAYLGGQIWDEAEAAGYTKGPSGPAYRRELELLSKGYWPVTYISEAGNLRSLMHMAFAIRWDDSPLPWEARFLGDNDGILPERIEATFKVAVGGHEFPKFQHYTELNSRQNQDQLRLLSLLRYEIVGERTEFKFMGGPEPSLVFLRELLHATSEYALHKYSRRTPDAETLAAFKRAHEKAPVNEQTVRMIARSLSSPHSQVIEDFLVKFLSEPLQPYVANSGVYGHMSDKPQGNLQHNPRASFFERRLQLPPSLYSFLEGPGIGELGVRTDITGTTTAYFETHVLRSLDTIPSLMSRPAVYLDRKDWVPGFISCTKYLSYFEQALFDFERERQKK